MLSDSEIYPELTTIFRDIFLRDDLTVTPDMTAKQIQGWDSFRHIEIMMACEQRWTIEFTSREIDDLLCVGDLARAIASKASRA